MQLPKITRRWTTLTLAVIACRVIFYSPTAAASLCKEWDGDVASLDGLRIGSIIIDANDIFNTTLQTENKWVHRLANKLHYQSRRETVQRQLLFDVGDDFSQRVLAESERQLRAQRYFSDADIRVLQVCDNEVWIRVRTSDTWSTIPEISFSRVAGESQSKFALEENNLFGLGQRLTISYENELDRVSRGLSYTNNDWAGRQQVLGLSLQNNQDGERYQLSLSRPYLSLTDIRAWSMGGHFDRRDTMLYEDAEIVETMGVEQRYLELNRSWSTGLVDRSLDRWTAGIRIDELNFYRVEDTQAQTTFDNRRERYPFLRYAHINEDFVELRHIRQLSEIEDINLGLQNSIELGYGARWWGSDDERFFVRASTQAGKQWSDQLLLLTEGRFNTQLAGGKLSRIHLSLQAQLHKRLSHQDQFFIEIEFDATHRSSQDFQLAIGGDSGLRGYPYKALTGNRKARLSTELRHYPDWHPWQLVRFGAALFADYGTAWKAGGDSPEWLWDLGVGLRLGSSKSSSGNVLHLDMALPEGQGSAQWTATAKTHF